MALARTLEEIEEKLRIGEELPYEILGLEEKYVLVISGLARQLAEAGQHEEASDVYFLLTVLHPKNYFYWLNLGICEQQLKNFEAAVVAYYTALSCGYWKPQPAFYCAQCFYHLREWQASQRFLNLMRKTGRPTSSTQALFDAAEALELRLEARLRS